MEIKTIKSFQRLKDEMEQKGYSKEQQLSILVPLYEDILGSLLDMLKSEKDKYDDFVATFQFLRAVDRVDAKDKERYCEIDRYMKNTLKNPAQAPANNSCCLGTIPFRFINLSRIKSFI